MDTTINCVNCKADIPTIHMDCPECDWWNGLYLFNYSKEFQDNIKQQREIRRSKQC